MKGPLLERSVKREQITDSSLALVQAIAWLGEGSSILSGEMKEKKLV
jgi:hypothetical protein